MLRAKSSSHAPGMSAFTPASRHRLTYFQRLLCAKLGQSLTAARRFRQLRSVHREPAFPSVLCVTFLVFVRDCLSWSRRRVQIAKAAIAREYITQMVARLECGVLAVPVHSALSDINYRAPRSITTSSAGRGSDPRCRCKSRDTKCQFRKGFRHDDPISE